MSIDIETFIIADQLDPREWVTTPRWIGSVQFSAGLLRSFELMVGYDPIDDASDGEGNPYHGGVWGAFTRPIKEALRQSAAWYVEIPDASLT